MVTDPEAAPAFCTCRRCCFLFFLSHFFSNSLPLSPWGQSHSLGTQAMEDSDLGERLEPPSPRRPTEHLLFGPCLVVVGGVGGGWAGQLGAELCFPQMLLGGQWLLELELTSRSPEPC